MTNAIFTTEYSSKSVAARGAKRAGLVEGTFDIRKNDADKFYVVSIERVTPEPILDNSNDPAIVNVEKNLMAPVIATGVAPDFVPAADLIVAKVPELVVPVVADAPIKSFPPKGLAYKEMARISKAKSEKETPVEYIWATLSNTKFASRKAAIEFFVKQGINIHTARTQFQRHRAASGVRPVAPAKPAASE